MASLSVQLTWLFVLAIPVACVAWTVTHEEIFSDFTSYCKGQCARARSLITRKFFYLFTCEYCFSHYVTIAFLLLTGYKLLLNDWRGYMISGFSIVWIANCYMSIYAMLRVTLKKERAEAQLHEKEVQLQEAEVMKMEKEMQQQEGEKIKP